MVRARSMIDPDHGEGERHDGQRPLDGADGSSARLEAEEGGDSSREGVQSVRQR